MSRMRTSQAIAARLRFAIRPSRTSRDQRAVQIGGPLRAHVLNTSRPVGSEIVVAQAVARWIDDRLEAGLEKSPLRRVGLDLEHRQLNPLAETVRLAVSVSVTPPVSAVMKSPGVSCRRSIRVRTRRSARTGRSSSIRSRARLGRPGLSRWRKPTAGSSPTASHAGAAVVDEEGIEERR